MRKALAMLAVLASALWASPVLAETSPKLELAAWVSQNTDLAVSQIAITGPENVYSLEQIGPRLPTGEVLALVRTEAVSDTWRDAHQFQSWDAHMLMDCQGGRVRVLRSASYAERDRGGGAKADERGDAWFSPDPQTPAATLLSAACDPAFSWPLRGASTTPSRAPGPKMSFIQTASATVTGPIVAAVTPAPPQDVVQIARASVARLPEEGEGFKTLAAAITLAADPPQMVVAAAPRHARASPGPTQFASVATLERASYRLEGASFTMGPLSGENSAVAPRQPAGARHSAVFEAAVAATRSVRRLADASRGWVFRRVEMAFRHEEPLQRLDPGYIRQAQAY